MFGEPAERQRKFLVGISLMKKSTQKKKCQAFPKTYGNVYFLGS